MRHWQGSREARLCPNLRQDLGNEVPELAVVVDALVVAKDQVASDCHCVKDTILEFSIWHVNNLLLSDYLVGGEVAGGLSVANHHLFLGSLVGRLLGKLEVEVVTQVAALPGLVDLCVAFFVKESFVEFAAEDISRDLRVCWVVGGVEGNAVLISKRSRAVPEWVLVAQLHDSGGYVCFVSRALFENPEVLHLDHQLLDQLSNRHLLGVSVPGIQRLQLGDLDQSLKRAESLLPDLVRVLDVRVCGTVSPHCFELGFRE